MATGAQGEADDLEYAEHDDFDAFNRWHRPRLVQWYRQRGLSLEDANDVAQEALAGLAQRWPSLKTAEHRRRSYFTITKNKLTDFWRRQERRIQPEVSLDDDAAGELVASEQETNPDVIVGGATHPVWHAVEKLPPLRRDAILGRVVHGMEYDELADATGRTENALRQDVARGLAWLRRALRGGYCLIGAAAARARRVQPASAKAGLASASSTALSVIPQGALLSLLLTSPLHVLPARSTLTEAAGALAGAGAAPLPGPVRAGVVSLLAPAAPAAAWRARPAHRPTAQRRLRDPRSLGVGVPRPLAIDPPRLCLKNRCGTGERVTVRVLGRDVALPAQNAVEVCWAVPPHTQPYVTCSRTSDPP